MSAGLSPTTRSRLIRMADRRGALLVKSGRKQTCIVAGHAGRDMRSSALKVYKSRKNPSFRDAAIYQEGRVITMRGPRAAVRTRAVWPCRRVRRLVTMSLRRLTCCTQPAADVPCPVRSGEQRNTDRSFVGQGAIPAPQLASGGFFSG